MSTASSLGSGFRWPRLPVNHRGPLLPLRDGLRVDAVTGRQRPQARLTMLYRSTDCRSRRGAPVRNLAHSASFHSREKTAPSNPGIKQVGGIHKGGIRLKLSDARAAGARPRSARSPTAPLARSPLCWPAGRSPSATSAHCCSNDCGPAASLRRAEAKKMTTSAARSERHGLRPTPSPRSTGIGTRASHRCHNAGATKSPVCSGASRTSATLPPVMTCLPSTTLPPLESAARIAATVGS
jgi:hypothetical protein